MPAFSISLVTDARVFYLAAADEPQCQEWLDRLQSVILTNARRGMLAKSLRGDALRRQASASQRKLVLGKQQSFGAEGLLDEEQRAESRMRRAMLSEATHQGDRGTPGALSALQELLHITTEQSRRGDNLVMPPSAALPYQLSPLGGDSVAASTTAHLPAEGMPAPNSKAEKRQQRIDRARMKAAAAAGGDAAAAAAPAAAIARQQKRRSLKHAAQLQHSIRKRRHVTRWEHVSGNVPRWELSMLNDVALRHIPAFAPYLSIRQTAQHGPMGEQMGGEYTPGHTGARHSVRPMDGTDGGYGGDDWVESMLLAAGVYKGVGLAEKGSTDGFQASALVADDDDDDDDDDDGGDEEDERPARAPVASRRRAVVLPGGPAVGSGPRPKSGLGGVGDLAALRASVERGGVGALDDGSPVPHAGGAAGGTPGEGSTTGRAGLATEGDEVGSSSRSLGNTSGKGEVEEESDLSELARQLPLLYVAQHTLEQVARHAGTSHAYDDTGVLRGAASELDRLVSMSSDERTHWLSMMMQWRQMYHRGSGVQLARRRGSSVSSPKSPTAFTSGSSAGVSEHVDLTPAGAFIVPPPRLMDFSLPGIWERLSGSPANILHQEDAALKAMPHLAEAIPSASLGSRAPSSSSKESEAAGGVSTAAWLARNRGLTQSLGSLMTPLPKQIGFDVGGASSSRATRRLIAQGAMVPLVPALPKGRPSTAQALVPTPGTSAHANRDASAATVPHSLASMPHLHADPLAPSDLSFPALQGGGRVHVPGATKQAMASLRNSLRRSASGAAGMGDAKRTSRGSRHSAMLVAGLAAAGDSRGGLASFSTPLSPSVTDQAFSVPALQHLNYMTRAIRSARLFPDDAAAAADLARRDHGGTVDVLERLISMFKVHNVPAGTVIRVGVRDVWGMHDRSGSSKRPPAAARGTFPVPASQEGGQFPMALLSPHAFAAAEAVGLSPILEPKGGLGTPRVGIGMDSRAGGEHVFGRSLAEGQQGGNSGTPFTEQAKISAFQRQLAARTVAAESLPCLSAAAGLSAHNAVSPAVPLGGSSLAPALVMSGDSFFILLQGRVRTTSTIVDTTHNVFHVPGQPIRDGSRTASTGGSSPHMRGRQGTMQRQPSVVKFGDTQYGNIASPLGDSSGPVGHSTVGSSRLRSGSRITLHSTQAPIKRDASSMASAHTLMAPRSKRGSLRPSANVRGSVVALTAADSSGRRRSGVAFTGAKRVMGRHASFVASTGSKADLIRRVSVLLGSAVLRNGHTLWPVVPWWLGHDQMQAAEDGSKGASLYDVPPLSTWRTTYRLQPGMLPVQAGAPGGDVQSTYTPPADAGTTAGTWGHNAMQWVEISADAGPAVLGGGGIPGKLLPAGHPLTALQALGLREAGDTTSTPYRRSSAVTQGLAQSNGSAKSRRLAAAQRKGGGQGSSDDSDTEGIEGGVGLFSDVADHHSQVNIPAGLAQGNSTAAQSNLGSEVIAASSCFLLELPAARFPALRSWYPHAGKALQEMAWWAARPRAIVGSIPCLASTFTACTPDGFAFVGTAGAALLSSIAALVKPVFVPQGGTLYSPMDEGDCAYVVMRGEVSISAKASSTGMGVLLGVKTRGMCLGEEALVLPGPRVSKAVALSDTFLLRLSHCSLKQVLTRYPRAWGMVRDCVRWREASTLVRLPALAALTGGESDAERLAPLSDMFQLVVLDATSTHGARLYTEEKQPFSALRHKLDQWCVQYQDRAEQAMTEDQGAGIDPLEHMREAAELSLPSVVPMRMPLQQLRGRDVQSLMVVTAGAVDIAGEAADLFCTQNTAASSEWLGGGTLFSPESVTGRWEQGLTLTANASVSLYTSVLVLHKDVIENFTKVLPSGTRRLGAWAGQVADSMRLAVREGVGKTPRPLPRPTNSAAADEAQSGCQIRTPPPPPPRPNSRKGTVSDGPLKRAPSAPPGRATQRKRPPQAPLDVDSANAVSPASSSSVPSPGRTGGIGTSTPSPRTKRPSLLQYGQGGSAASF